MRRSKDEISKEIDALLDLKDKVRPTSMFGDDNRAAIEAQIDILQGNVAEDEIYDVFDDHAADSANEAVQWLNGESESDTLSEDWRGIAK